LTSDRQHESSALIFSVVIFGQIIMGGTFPAAKIALRDFDAFTLALLRYALASSALLLITYLRGRMKKIEKQDVPRLLLLGVLAIPLNQLLFLYGLQYTSPARSAIWFGATPIFVFLLAVPILGEKATLRKVLGTFASFVGVALVLEGGGRNGGTIFGDMIIILAVISWAFYTVLGKPLLRKYGPLPMTAYALSIGTAIYFPFGLYLTRHFDFTQVTTAGWAGLLYIALATSVVGYSIWYWALARMEAIKLAIFQNIQPIAGTALSVLFVNETLGIFFFVGGILIVGGVLLTQRG
jgi:drug/metabolite transporter (DMT)-like permease